MMISFELGSNKFQQRAASVILHKGRVLLQRNVNDDIWFIPGGRVEFFETSTDTIEREMIEEFSIEVINRKLVWVVENFVEFPNLKVHEIGLFYIVTLPLNHNIYCQEKEFVGSEPDFINKWVHLDELDDYMIVPKFVIPELRCLDINRVKHIVNTESSGGYTLIEPNPQ